MKLIKKGVVIFGVIILLLVGGMFSVNSVYDKLLQNISFNEDNLQENINSYIDEENNESSIIDHGKSIDNKNEEEEIITIIEVKDIEKEISTIDKIKVINIVNSSFTVEEIKGLTSLAEDGLEQDELSYIKDIIKEKLSSEDIIKFKEIYGKYQ